MFLNRKDGQFGEKTRMDRTLPGLPDLPVQILNEP
jgi:hypothetical protein